MKIMLLIIVFVLFFTYGCDERDPVIAKNKMDLDKFVGTACLETIEYDSCEYVVLKSSLGYALTHKGNCRFCTKRLKDE